MSDLEKRSSDFSSTDEFFETCGIRVITSLQRIIRAVDIHSRKLNSDFNITVPQMICLYSLVKAGEITQSELSKRVNMGMSTINGIIDRLEVKKLVVRERDTKDRRKVLLRVTESGKELTRSAPLLLQDKLSQSLRNLPELEQASIALSLERVVQLMEAEGVEASPNLVTSLQIKETNQD